MPKTTQKEYSKDSFYSVLERVSTRLGLPNFAEDMAVCNERFFWGLDLENARGVGAAFWLAKKDENGMTEFQMPMYDTIEPEPEMWDKVCTQLLHHAHEDGGLELYFMPPDGDHIVKLRYTAQEGFSIQNPLDVLNKERPDPDSVKPSIFHRFIHFFNKDAYAAEYKTWTDTIAAAENYDAMSDLETRFNDTAAVWSNYYPLNRADQKVYSEKQMKEASDLDAQQNELSDKEPVNEQPVEEAKPTEAAKEEAKPEKEEVEVSQSEMDYMEELLTRQFEYDWEPKPFDPEEDEFERSPHDLGDFILIDGKQISIAFKLGFKPEKNGGASYEDFVASEEYRQILTESVARLAKEGHQVELYGLEENETLPKYPDVIMYDKEERRFGSRYLKTYMVKPDAADVEETQIFNNRMESLDKMNEALAPKKEALTAEKNLETLRQQLEESFIGGPVV